jgi:hypothetical protein
MDGKETTAGQDALEALKKEANLKKEIAMAQQATAEAEKATVVAEIGKLKAQFPAGEARPLEGKITADEKSGYTAVLAAYDAMNTSADKIAAKVNGLALKENTRILIVDSSEFSANDVLLGMIREQIMLWYTQLSGIDKQIQQKLEPEKKAFYKMMGAAAVAPALTLAPLIISAVGDVIGYLRMDYDIKGKEVTLNDQALRFRVAGGINKHEVYLQNFCRITGSKLVADFNDCVNTWADIKCGMALLKKTVIDRLKLQGPAENASADLKEAEAVYTRAESLSTAFESYSKAVTLVPEGKKISPLTGAVMQEYIDTRKITHLLYLAVVSAGGESIYGRGIFLWGQVTYRGGCAVSYILSECDGRIISADTIYGVSRLKTCLCRNSPLKFLGGNV